MTMAVPDCWSNVQKKTPRDSHVVYVLPVRTVSAHVSGVLCCRLRVREEGPAGERLLQRQRSELQAVHLQELLGQRLLRHLRVLRVLLPAARQGDQTKTAEVAAFTISAVSHLWCGCAFASAEVFTLHMY